MQPRDTRYLLLDDGRKLCFECLDSAVMDTYECQPLYLEIQDFYEGLHMKVEQQVPMLLVERQALNEAMEGEKNVNANVFVLHLCILISWFTFNFDLYLIFIVVGSPSHAWDQRTLLVRRTDGYHCRNYLPSLWFCRFSCNDICILDQTSITSSTMLPDLKEAKGGGQPIYRHHNWAT